MMRMLEKIINVKIVLFSIKGAKTRFLSRFIVVWMAGLLVSTMASGAIIVYEGTDPSATDASGLINSKAAQADFESAVGPDMVVEDFEDVPVGSHTTLNLGDLTLTATDGIEVRYDSSEGIAVSGIKCAGTYGSARVIFTFAESIDAFGSYFSDVGDFGGVLTAHFNDGEQYVLDMPDTLPGDYGGMFFGFTDFGKEIVRVEIWNSSAAEWFAFDDVQWHVIPEPGTVLLLGLGGLALLGKHKKLN